MIRCTVCGKENDDLSVVCSSCRGFLQARSEALDLFATIWGLFESPRRTFRKIVLARHKNYVLVLSALFGINLLLDLAWLRNIGDVVPNLAVIIGTATLAGPGVGILLVFAVTLLLRYAMRILGGTATHKNMFGALAYATAPSVLALVFVVPIQLAVFGIEFFGTNPPARIVRPTEFFLIAGLKTLASSWTLFFVVEGTMAANGFQRNRLVPVLLIIVALVALLAVGISLVNIHDLDATRV